MFSGIIKHMGRVLLAGQDRLTIVSEGVKATLGDSIAVNGVCLTVASMEERNGAMTLSFDLSEETCQKTTLAQLPPGQPVNLELALGLSDSLGGHIVQGHVDGVGSVTKIEPNDAGKDIWFELPSFLMPFVVEKGSIAINGVSLTISEIEGNRVAVSLIPYTLANTNLQLLKVGQSVNVETDIIGKYVAKYMSKR